MTDDNAAESADCECFIECDGEGSLGGGERCRATRLRTLRELNARMPPMQQPEPTAEQGQWHVHAWEGDSTAGRWAVYDAEEERRAVCLTEDEALAIVADLKLVPDLLAALRLVNYNDPKDGKGLCWCSREWADRLVQHSPACQAAQQAYAQAESATPPEPAA